MSWVEKRIGELGKIITGKTPSTKVREYFDGKFLFVKPSDIDYSSYYCRKTETTITDRAKDKHKNQFVPRDAVLFTCIGTIGKCAISSEECLTNQQINAIVVNGAHDPKFIYYLMLCRKDQILGIGLGGGVAVPIINKTTFSNVRVLVPELNEQKAIAELLSKYDDLIENNRRRIELLEEAARQLYKEWFVRFRFPSHEHVRIIDGVPEGWEVVKVDSVLAKIKRPGKIKKESYEIDGEVPCVDQSREFIGGYTDNVEAKISIPLPLIVFGDHTRILKFIDFPFACGADGTQLLYPKDERLSIEYFYFSLDSIDLSNYFYARHFKFLKDQVIFIPEISIIRAFTLFANTCMKQIRILRNTSHELAQARDLLLPKLMSGEIAP